MKLLFLPILGMLVSGCASEQLYATGQAYQRGQCLQTADQETSKDCLDKTNTNYHDYKAIRKDSE